MMQGLGFRVLGLGGFLLEGSGIFGVWGLWFGFLGLVQDLELGEHLCHFGEASSPGSS